EHCADGAWLPLDLRVCGLLCPTAQDDQEGEDAGHETGDDPQHEREHRTAGEDEPQHDSEDHRDGECTCHPPHRLRIVAAGHLEDPVHLLETTVFLGRLGSLFFSAGHSYKDTGFPILIFSSPGADRPWSPRVSVNPPRQTRVKRMLEGWRLSAAIASSGSWVPVNAATSSWAMQRPPSTVARSLPR